MTISCNFCISCGSVLQNQQTKSSWESKFECLNCNLQVKVIHGDMGETDSFYFYRNSEGTELGPLADDEIEEPIR